MSYKIEAVEGIGPSYAAKLKAAGISTTAGFIKMCCNKNGRQSLASQTGISEKSLLTWVNLSDLMRISGIGPQFSELLEASGVDTVKELRNRRPDSLVAKMKSVNAEKKLTRSVPSESAVIAWVEAAKKMDPAISH